MQNCIVPSPLQVSLPGSPPAHVKDGWSLKYLPKRVVRSLFWQSACGTTGKSSFFRITWYFPSFPKWSLPQPEAVHRAPSKTVPWGGKQIVPMLSWSLAGVSSINKATLLYNDFGLKFSWTIFCMTLKSWCSKSSLAVCVSHSPILRRFLMWKRQIHC